jgi:hypothetical protein
MNFSWTSIAEAISITAVLVKVNLVSAFFKEIRDCFGVLKGHFKLHFVVLKCLSYDAYGKKSHTAQQPLRNTRILGFVGYRGRSLALHFPQ